MHSSVKMQEVFFLFFKQFSFNILVKRTRGGMYEYIPYETSLQISVYLFAEQSQKHLAEKCSGAAAENGLAFFCNCATME